MSEATLTQTEEDERLLTAYVARDGQELGAFWRDEIDERARAGEFQPNDYYWHEGMDDWVRLEDFLGAGPWIPPPEPPSLRSRLITIGVIAAGFAVALAIAAFFVTRRDGAAPVRPPRFDPATFSQAGVDPVKDREIRDKAAAELRAKIERLPDRATPPLNTFYYDVTVNMRRSAAPHTPWEALMRGSENAINPETNETLRRTEFTLQTEYRNGEWVFTHYKGAVRNLGDNSEVNDEHDARTFAPPLLVTLLGLKIEPPPDER